ncbi:MAG TPA: membrane dipeptidase [Steroidobacter sp.]
MSRRTFLSTVAAGVLVGGSASAARSAHPASDGARRWENAIIVNALGSLGNPNQSGRESESRARPGPRLLDARALREAHESGLTAVNVTLGYVAGSAEPFELTIRSIADWEERIRLQSPHLMKVYTADDIVRAKRERRIGIIYGFQNAAMVGEQAERIDLFANFGVRAIQLTYNTANQVGDGAMVPEDRGLKPFGREVVERLNANRIMVDLSHSGTRTCLDAARFSKQPVSINHTGCRALVDLPRNKSDEELRLVASRGGFIGIYFMPFLNAAGHARAEDVVAHVEHAVSVCGEDHVGIGTDGPVTAIDDLESYKTRLAQEVERRRAAGVGATGERADTFPFVLDLRGVNQFYELAERLRRRGHSTTRIEKILGLNFLRYAREVWGA